MDSGLPDNSTLKAFARQVPWQTVEETREHFQEYLDSIRSKRGSHPIALSSRIIWHLAHGYYSGDEETPDGNALLSRNTSLPILVGTILGKRFQQGPCWIM